MATTSPSGGGGGPPGALQGGVRELLDQEVALNKELTETLAHIKKAREARDQSLKNPKSKVNQQVDAVEAKIAAALAKKNALYEEMNALRAAGGKGKGNTGDAQASVGENLSILRLRRVPLREKKDALQETVRQASTRAREDTLRANKLRVKLPQVEGVAQGEVVTLLEMATVLKRLGDRLAHAEAQRQVSAVDHLKLQKKQYEKAQPSLEEYWQLIETSFDARAKEQAGQKELEAVTRELEEVEGQLAALADRQATAAAGPQEREERLKREAKAERLWEQIQPLTQEIDRLRQEKQRARDAVKSTDGSKQPLAEELREATARRDVLFEQLKEVRARIPTRTVAYNKAYHSDLIGPKGATVHGLQEDFGVLLTVSLERGEVTLRGGEDDVAACEAAIQELLKNAQDSKCSATMKYDAAVSRELIGPGGSHIQKLQDASGARINVDSKTATITITGAQAAVELARRILDEFFANTCRATLKFRADLGDVVVGRGGRTVRRIQEETGAKNINIKKDAGTIEIVGSAEAVEAAKQAYEALLLGFQGKGLEMKLAPEMVGAIVGKGGANIMRVQDETGCLVAVDRNPAPAAPRGAKGGHATVTIRGPPAGVTAARAMIEEMLGTNSRDAERVPFDPNLRTFLIRPSKDDPAGLCPLEKVKRDSNCARVEAVRGENYVAITGRKECTAVAVQMLTDLLKEHTREVTQVPFPPVLFGPLGARGEEGTESALDAIRREFGCDAVTANRSGTVAVVADAPAAALAAAKVLEIVQRMQGNIESLALPSERVFPIIIGSGGQNINRMRRETNTEITLDRDTLTAAIYGPPEGRAKAVEALKKVLAEAAEQGRNGTARSGS